MLNAQEIRSQLVDIATDLNALMWDIDATGQEQDIYASLYDYYVAKVASIDNATNN